MKKTLTTVVLIITLFLMVGCDNIPDDIKDDLPTDIVDVLPSINVLGEDIIEIEQYTEFTDPGAEVTGDFDIEITVDTDLDITSLGEYTVTYSVVYEGTTYSGTRTVRVVEPEVIVEIQPTITKLSVTESTASYFVNFTDDTTLTLDGKAELFLDDELVTSYSILTGDNYINFSLLDSETDYVLVIEMIITDEDNEIHTSNETYSFTTEADNNRDTLFTLTDKAYNTANVSLLITDDSNSMFDASLVLYQGDTEIDTYEFITGNNEYSFENLDDNTQYRFVYTYSFMLNGVEQQSDTELVFTTLEIPVPEVILFLCEPDFYSIDCGLGVTSEGITSLSTRVEVWVDGAYHSLANATNQNTLIEVEGLEPGTEYVLKLYADYVLELTSDQIAYVLLDEVTVTTGDMVSYTAPTIENLVITTELGFTNSVTLEFDLLDPDNTIDGYILLMLDVAGSTARDNESIVVGHNSITFTGYPVYDNTTYLLRVKTNYQSDETTFLYDTYVFEETFITPPAVEAVSWTSNQSTYFHSDRFVMILTIENEDDLPVEYVTVNGVKIYADDFLTPSTNKTIYLNMGIETDYTDYSYHLTDFAVTLSDDSSYIINFDQTLSFRLQQPGAVDPVDAEVNILEIFTDDYTVHVRENDTDYAEVTIRLDNKYNLDVYSILVNGETYLASQFKEGSSSKQIVLDIEIGRYSNGIYARDLVYVRNDVQINSENDTPISIHIYGYYNEDVILISTPEELNSIDTTLSYKVYMLTADIDMQTITNFSPIGTSQDPFDGVFDGNGYVIYNLNISSYSVDQGTSEYIGLFGKTSAFLYDIKLTNTNIFVLTNPEHTLYVGTLAGSTTGKVLDCGTFGSNVIEIQGMTKGYVGGLVAIAQGYMRDNITSTTIDMDGLDNEDGSRIVLVGGLVGLGDAINIDTSSSSGTITITNSNNVEFNVGGLVGLWGNDGAMNTPRINISNSYSSVDINTTNMGQGSTGGLVGEIVEFTGIVNSYASGSVHSQRGYIGGLVGRGYVHIENSFAVGNVSSDAGSSNKLSKGGTYLYIENSYVYDEQTVMYNGSSTFIADDIEGRITTISSGDFNDDYDFYTRVLQWDTYYFNFLGLDIENGDLPTHK